MTSPSSHDPAPTARRATGAAVALLLAGGLAGCGPLSSLPWVGGRTPDGPAPLVLEEDGDVSPEREAEAAELLRTASEALAGGNAPRAWDTARRIEAEYPRTTSSGPSLLVRARAGLEIGRHDDARALAARYAGLLPEGDPRSANLLLFDAEELLAAGEILAGVRAVLDLPADLPEETRDWALVRLRAVADSLGREELDGLLADSAAARPLAAPLVVAAARATWLAGDLDGATRLADEAVALAPTPEDAAAARALAARIRTEGVPGPSRERMETTGPFELARPVTVGVLLPRTGSPALRSFAELVEEGVRVALEGERAPDGITVEILDDGEGAEAAARAYRTFEAGGAIGIVGPLEEDALLAVADARGDTVPLVSPTAPATGGRPAVYSLGAPDPGAAWALADYAVGSDLEQVVVIHPDTEQHRDEAEAFRSRMQELGGSVLRVMSYPPGTTTFREVLQTARHLDPRALVLPVPAGDILALAPQISFFGLDTLGIRLLGTGEWTDEEVLSGVAPRHTNGVVVATPRPPDESGGAGAFEEAYERHFRRSLRSPVPALGYDAARLLLQGLRSGARDASELRTALEWIEGFHGATGVLSVDDGRIRREHRLVCIQDGELVPIAPGERTRYHRPERRGVASRGEPERVPLGPAQLFCPGLAADTVGTAAPGAPPDTAGAGRS